MRSWLIGGGAVVALALLVAVVAPSFAAPPPPPGAPVAPGYGVGYGPGYGPMHGPGFGPMGGPGRGPAYRPMGRGMRGHGGGIGLSVSAEVRESLRAATLAAAGKTLALTPQALQQTLASGKTLWALAAERNVALPTLATAMQTARVDAVKQALATGKLTQAQGDWLLSRGPRFAQMPGWGPRP